MTDTPRECAGIVAASTPQRSPIGSWTIGDVAHLTRFLSQNQIGFCRSSLPNQEGRMTYTEAKQEQQRRKQPHQIVPVIRHAEGCLHSEGTILPPILALAGNPARSATP